MTITQTLGASSTPSTLHIKKQDQHDPKAQSFAAISESMKATAPEPSALTNVAPETQVDKTDHANEEKTALQQLREYMEMSPAERIRANMLNEMGLTEEELEDLPPDEQQAIELKITQHIEDTLGVGSMLVADKAI